MTTKYGARIPVVPDRWREIAHLLEAFMGAKVKMCRSDLTVGRGELLVSLAPVNEMTELAMADFAYDPDTEKPPLAVLSTQRTSVSFSVWLERRQEAA